MIFFNTLLSRRLAVALPARSKICYNQPAGSHGDWNAKYIEVPTFWQALKAGHKTTAAIMLPRSVGGDYLQYERDMGPQTS